jgi:plastocyanin
MRWNRLLALTCPAMLVAALSPAGAQKPTFFDKAVKKIEAKFEPAEAKPGQTVTFQIVMEMNKGFHTYPTMQPEKAAENFVNIIKFPKPGDVIFVGKLADPKKFETHAEPMLGIKELHVLTGTAIYTRKAVVSPKAKAGMVEVKLDLFEVMVCDASNCFPKKVPLTARFKVLEGPAAPVEKQFAEEVAKAVN